MRAQVKNVKVKGYTFTGYIIVDGQEYDVEGEYGVTFKGQYPSVDIESIYLTGPYQDVNLPEYIDLYHLAANILETDDGTWHDDYTDSLLEQRWG